jgi:hypothetical protein
MKQATVGALLGMGALLAAVTRNPAAGSRPTGTPAAHKCSDVGEVREAELVIAPLSDAGVTMPKGPDGKPINERFSSAIRSQLTELAKNQYALREKSVAKLAPEVLRLRLEGKLVHLDSDDAGGGAYNCTLRLYDDGRPRRLVGHWSATAATLRDLTSNIRHDPSISPLGLLGELCYRVNRAVTALQDPPANRRLTDLLKTVPQADRPEMAVTYTRADGPNPVASATTLRPGERYSVRISSPRSGRLFLFSQARGGPAGLMLADELDGVPIASGRIATLPALGQFTAPASPGTLELVSLIETDGADDLRHKNQAVHPANPTAADNDRSTNPQRTLLPPRAVQIIGVDPEESEPNSPLARILNRITIDPPGVWLAQVTAIKIERAR